jgi:pimeloyl-ACP methyl ester carboxylesterase
MHYPAGKSLTALASLSALVVGAFGFSTANATELPIAAPPPPPINWQPCSGSPFPNRDCATLTVPLDYANHAAGTIELPVARARATGSKVGTLVYNPGGPGFGATGTIGFRNLDSSFTPLLQSRFDIVTFDPRGAAQGIQCMDSGLQEQYWETNLIPRTSGELNARVALERQVTQGCLTNNDPLARHVDSASTVRDMEQLRRALGLSQFNYMGRSYGTFLGYRYAKLYPGRLRAMVLDAAIDRGVADRQSLTEGAVTFELMWKKYQEWCQVAANPCKMRGRDIDAVFKQTVAQARVNPLPAPRAPITQRPVNDWILSFVTQVFLQPGDITFNSVDQLVYESSLGDASLARYLYDAATGVVDPSGTYAPDNQANRSITCVDTRWSQTLRSAADLQQLLQQAKASAPRFGEASVAQGPAICIGYPVAPVEPTPLPVQLSGVPPFVVIGATLDGSTPYVWSARIASQIQASRFIKRTGYGHISYDKSRCVQQKVDNYLINLVLPANGSTCPTDPDLYPPQDLLLPPLP